MKILLSLLLIHMASGQQIAIISRIRNLYQTAPLVKQDANQLDELMVGVNADHDSPVLICYKGAAEMIDAKYTLNPIMKFLDFKKGKDLINNALVRDSLNLEMRFIRFSIQSSLPAYLGYSNDIPADRHFLLLHTVNIKDLQLKEMIVKYFSTRFPGDVTALKK